jgi:hypothetical protein
MALIVEDGTGLLDAESYASVAEADAYHAARGNTAWANVAEKEAMLRRATDYMTQAYRMRWAGDRVYDAQALDWPRAWVPITSRSYAFSYLSQTLVPIEVKRACMELALIAASGDLNAPLDRTTVREQVGEIAVEYDTSAPEYRRFRGVDMMLTPYLAGSPTSVGLVR